MIPINLEDILEQSKFDNSNFFGSSKNHLLFKFGNPTEIETYKNQEKFYHYDNVRFGINQNEVESVEIFFYNYPDIKYNCKADEEIINISKELELNKLFFLLNDKKIEWAINHEQSKFDYLMISLSNNIRIYYTIYDGFLDRIYIPVSSESN